VYPNAPIVLVAAEVRHPAAETLAKAQQAALKRAVAKFFPLSNPATVTNITQVSGAAPTVTQAIAPRFTSRDRTTSVTFRDAAIVVETTTYGHFGRLLDLLECAVSARLDVGEIDGLERVGLRYIDEIRVPDILDNGLGEDSHVGAADDRSTTDWGTWLDGSLLGPAPTGATLGLQAAQWQGLMVFNRQTLAEEAAGADGTDSLVLRYGPGEGYALDPGGELKRATPPPGPFFLLDIDSFWTSGATVPALDPAELVEITQRLHAPVRGLFESLITERLRAEVLRK
jgi:uncharacterized protein (TIGR04255 family)